MRNRNLLPRHSRACGASRKDARTAGVAVEYRGLPAAAGEAPTVLRVWRSPGSCEETSREIQKYSPAPLETGFRGHRVSTPRGITHRRLIHSLMQQPVRHKRFFHSFRSHLGPVCFFGLLSFHFCFFSLRDIYSAVVYLCFLFFKLCYVGVRQDARFFFASLGLEMCALR